MKYPEFAFVVVLSSLIVYNGQLGCKIAVKFWWTQYPAYKVAFSWKTLKSEGRKVGWGRRRA
jgi:hypothetical protein